MKELINKIGLSKIIKIFLFSLISITLVVFLIKFNFKNKSADIKNIKIDLNKESRSNYPKTETLWGTIEIPSVKVKTNLYKGSDELLKYGALHHNETYFPTDGKVILIGASSEYFKNLDKVKKDDTITLNTIYGTYKYKVIKTRIRKIEFLKNEIDTFDTETLILYTNLNEKEKVVVYAR